MGFTKRLRHVWRDLSEEEPKIVVSNSERKTAFMPGAFHLFRPNAVNLLPKATAQNLRKFAETPVARRAINVVKNRIASMSWQVRLKNDATPTPDTDELLKVLRRNLEVPNAGDSFRTLLEQVLEDILVGGFGAIEMELTHDVSSPFHLWAVDGATIVVNTQWNGLEDVPRYSQSDGMKHVPLTDDELMYLRLNPRTHTPLGLGKLEVAFETINQLLQANRYTSRLASNMTAQYALWIDGASPEQYQRLAGWWKDEVEGSGEPPILTTDTKPEVLHFVNHTDAELRLTWQEFLIRMIANAFDLPPMLLGLQQDVNRSTAQEMAEEAFESSIRPVATLIAEHFTNDLFAKRLGLSDVEFVFHDLSAQDETKQMQIQVELLKAGVLTVDEVRSMRGLSKKSTPDA